MSINDVLTEKWDELLKRYYERELIELSNSYPEKRSLYVNFTDIDIFDPNLAEMLIDDPDKSIEAATQVLRGMDFLSGVTLDQGNVRIVKLQRRIKIRDIRSDSLGKLISIEGMAVKVTEVRPRIVESVFECPFCHHIFTVPQGGRQPTEPTECEQESGGCGRKVQKFKSLLEKSKVVNAQKIRLQESPEELRGSELPQAIDINLEDDIAGIIAPGNRVIITGILRAYQRTTQFGKTLFLDIYLDGNAVEQKEEGFEEIEITEEDEHEIMALKDQPDIYEKLIRSVAPAIYGYEVVKEAMILQLFAGIPKELPDGTRIRGDIHVLLVGDPAVAKSQLLTYQVNLSPRGIYTGGRSSTYAGLTAAAVKDEFGEGRWTLEAGALVLADKGIAAVDEIDKMKKEDRDALHEAMEQQTVTIAKAGITATLNSRCALLAAANPKYGRFDKYTAISEQINMPPTLLSRFDLIFTMMDRPNEEADTRTAKHILSAHYTGEILARGGVVKETEKARFDKGMRSIEPVVSANLLRKYVAWSKRKVVPVISEEAEQKFLAFYIGLRRQGYEDEEAPVPITARQLEALIRLGEARARARLSDTITTEDAERVINIVTYCLRHVFVDPETGKLDADWITVGTTKTRRDRARSIREIIKELEKEYGAEVPIDEVLDQAEVEGMEREKADEIIEVMKRDGILYSPGSGVIKFVK